jgi:hypothetical protein
MQPSSPTVRLLLPLLLTAPALAQEDYDERRAEVDGNVVKKLVAFGRRATGLKQAEMARVAFQMVLDHYDSDQPTARRGLGFRKVGDEWREGAVRLGETVADAKKAARARREWEKTRKLVSTFHGEFGMELIEAGQIARAHYQLERALEFQPGVEEWHLALGHQQIDGFFGTEEQVAFIRRFREIQAKAHEFSEREYEVEAVPQSKMPKALQVSGLEFFGARSEHFTHWVVESQEHAFESLQWAERAYAFRREVAGHATPRRPHRHQRYLAIVRTREQRETVLAKSPTTRGRYTFDQAKLFGSTPYKDGGWAYLARYPHSTSADNVVGHVTKRHLVSRCNDGFGEGCVHAMTWLLVGTVKSSYTDLQHTVTKDLEPLERHPDDWRKRLQTEIDADKDWPLAQIPRERIENFRDSARVKSWSFVLFLMARYPDRWFELVAGIPEVQGLTVEKVKECFDEKLGVRAGEVDAEWRDWARRGSRIGRATDW